MQIELTESRDNGRQMIPVHTGKVQIGIAYVPKPTPTQAQWVSKHTAPKSRAVIAWLVVSAVAALALVAGVARG